jgi:hypothetical protein
LGTKVGSRGQPVALTHGTLAHHNISQRGVGNKAHVSAVLQHDCALLGLSVQEAASLTRDAQLLVQADIMAPGGFWDGAAIIFVEWNEDYWPLGPAGRSGKEPQEQLHGLDFDAETMTMVSARKAVLVDRQLRLPVCLYACNAAPSVGIQMRSHLEPLAQMPARRYFSLDRSSSGFRYECPGVEQRMEMVGSHVVRENCVIQKRPHNRQPGLAAHVINPDPNPRSICLYAATWREFNFWYNDVMMAMFQDMGQVLWRAFPMCSTYTAALKRTVDTERRAYTDVGVFLEPTRVLGECCGFSSDYQAAVHNDQTDTLFTTAFVGKCGETVLCPCDVRGCAAGLFQPKANVWRKGALH